MAVTENKPLTQREDLVTNWREYADGLKHTLVIGVDTPDIPVETFRNRAYSAARRCKC